MCAPTATPIRNKLNRVLARSEDPKLREIIEVLLRQHQFASHTPAIPISGMSRCRDTAAELLGYCRSQLERYS